MNTIEINTFIEDMENYGDYWTEEQVKEVYGDKTLKEALNDRYACLSIMGNIVGTVLNR